MLPWAFYGALPSSSCPTALRLSEGRQARVPKFSFRQESVKGLSSAKGLGFSQDCAWEKGLRRCVAVVILIVVLIVRQVS